MDAAITPTISTASRVEPIRLGVWASTLALAAIGLLIVARRLAGALSIDLGVLRLAATLLTATVVVLGGRIVWRVACGTREVREELALAWTGSAALWLMSLGCAPPSIHNAAWLLWLPLVAADHFSRQASQASRGARPRGPTRINEVVSVETKGIPPLAPPFEGGESEPDGDILQQLIRKRDAAGIESIRGTLRADFAAGQRHATLHVGFCPPLERLPEIEVELADGPDAAVKVVQAFAHGAKIEVRLSEAAEEPCSAVIEIVAAPSRDRGAKGTMGP